MERAGSGIIGARNSRLLNRALDDADRQQVTGDATGTNTGSISAYQSPFGQVVTQDSFRQTTYKLLVVLVNAGPNGEADFDSGDARYWARAVYMTQATGDDSGSLPGLAIDIEGFWGPVVCMSAIASSVADLPVYEGDEAVALTGDTVTIVEATLSDTYIEGGGNPIFTFVPGGANTCISFLVTSDTTPGTAYRRYNGKSIVKGVVNATEDLIIENGAEPISIFSSNQLLVSPNTGAFGVEACGQVNDVDAGTGKRIVISWIGFASCEGAAPPASDGAI